MRPAGCTRGLRRGRQTEITCGGLSGNVVHQELGLVQLREAHHLADLIETGCYQGDGIAAALEAGFERVYSCDLDPACVDHCRKRFNDKAGIHFLVAALVTALAAFCEAALFWLDAHYTVYGGGREEKDLTKFPLPFDLQVIALRLGMDADVIAFDDLRVIRSADNPRWRPSENPDYFVADGLTLESLGVPFLGPHAFSVIQAAEGIGLLTPSRGDCPCAR